MEPISTFLIAASVFSSAASLTTRPRPEQARTERTSLQTELMFNTYAPVKLQFTPEIYASTRLLVAPTIFAPTMSPSSPEVSEPTRLLVAPEVKAPAFTTLKDALFEELAMYAPDHPAGDPGIFSKWEDIALAISFIRALPSGIPLPTLMRNDEGQIGMYWDNDDAYIDISIDSNGTFSLYSRIRSTDAENFVNNIDVDQINSNWAFEHLAPLAGHYAAAA